MQGEKAGEHLGFLTFRLDFNDYHQTQAQGQRQQSGGDAGGGRGHGSIGVSPLTHATSHHHQTNVRSNVAGSAFTFHDRDVVDDGRSTASSASAARGRGGAQQQRRGPSSAGVPIQLDQDYSPSK